MKHNAKHRGHHGDKKNRPAPAASANPAWERIKERFRKIDRGEQKAEYRCRNHHSCGKAKKSIISFMRYILYYKTDNRACNTA